MSDDQTGRKPDRSPAAIVQLIEKVRSAREQAQKVGWPAIENMLRAAEREIIEEVHDI
jgi:hypothetical protein